MTWTRSRLLAVGGLGAGLLALCFALASALGSPDAGITAAKAADATITSHTVRIGGAKVAIRALPSGICFTVEDAGGSAHACPAKTGAADIGFALTPGGVGGIAGAGVHAVIVKLTRKGTIWAPIHDGAFYVVVPRRYAARRVIKVLRDGSRTAFAV